jgi:hypothetical protein
MDATTTERRVAPRVDKIALDELWSEMESLVEASDWRWHR